MLKKTSTKVALSLIPLIAVIKILSLFPTFIENYYSNGLYLFISKALRLSFGWLPFSLGDVFYTLGILLIIRWFIKNIKRIVTDTKLWFVELFSVLSIVYFTFHLFWAFNYYRKPLHENLNLKADYTTEQLLETISILKEKTNALHNQLAKNDSTKVNYPFNKAFVLEHTLNSYENLWKTYPNLKYTNPSVKKSLLSYPLTIMGFSGYLNPFTNEAQVNSMIPIYKLPTTTAHEIAHQLGYAAENEANFIGFLASINNNNIYFKYSGYSFALRHCLGELFKRDPETYYEVAQTINKGIYKNYKEVRDFWDSHKNFTEPIFKETYSTFLKVNNQSKGIKSYSYVVALYVNYFTNKNL